ncbi:hypothetical protein [sulfur-oxidizing endosymbiont of Gigantopelta aegis]|uniref:hypothetical protein n=1 Tax=sulfur-oxidizing endosymbiont of Gigantopelta aegis TaxID=2794934 RepID=UPI0018DD5AD5|nr:hypothetical protein [sulfur-oxidizing endosymbiont of Gigantopelta aegis]
MPNKMKDKLILEVLLERFEKHRLPRLMDIKNKVNDGEKLDAYDIAFLDEVFTDAKKNEHFSKSADDELKQIIMKVLVLCKTITDKALENEKK